MKIQGMPRKVEGRTGHGVCPHLMLIHLDGLDFLGCAEVCGERTMRRARLAPISLAAISSFPPTGH